MGIFARIGQGLKKTKENFSKKLYSAFSGRKLDDAFYEELEMLLLSADVGVTATEYIIGELKDRAFGAKIKETDSARAILKEIMTEIVDYDIPEYSFPLVILVVGVNGVGKTTVCGKLAKHFKEIGKSVVLAGADTFRAGAVDQLSVWAERAGVRMIKHEEGGDASAVVFDAISSAKAKNTDVVIVDTAGRLHNKKNLMAELEKINRIIDREYACADKRTYIAIDATTGQNAVEQTVAFDEMIDLDGIILNKLDGTAKGGVILAVSESRELPVVYVGVGEKIDDLAVFDAKEYVNELF